MGGLTHALLTAGHNDPRVPGGDLLGAQSDGAEA
jgi:hypothetical protein